MSNVIGNVLVNQNDSNVIPGRKVLKSLLDLLQFRVRLDNQEIRTLWCPMTNTCQQETRDSVL